MAYNRRDIAFNEMKRRNIGKELTEDDKPPVLKEWMWWVGICMMVLASLFDFGIFLFDFN